MAPCRSSRPDGVRSASAQPVRRSGVGLVAAADITIDALRPRRSRTRRRWRRRSIDAPDHELARRRLTSFCAAAVSLLRITRRRRPGSAASLLAEHAAALALKILAPRGPAPARHLRADPRLSGPLSGAGDADLDRGTSAGVGEAAAAIAQDRRPQEQSRPRAPHRDFPPPGARARLRHSVSSPGCYRRVACRPSRCTRRMARSRYTSPFASKPIVTEDRVELVRAQRRGDRLRSRTCRPSRPPAPRPATAGVGVQGQTFGLIPFRAESLRRSPPLRVGALGRHTSEPHARRRRPGDVPEVLADDAHRLPTSLQIVACVCAPGG